MQEEKNAGIHQLCHKIIKNRVEEEEKNESSGVYV